MHVKYLVLSCSRVVRALEIVVDQTPNDQDGLGGTLLPWISSGASQYPVIHARVNPAVAVIAARTFSLRADHLEDARADHERRGLPPREYNERDTLSRDHWFGAHINPSEGR